MGIVKRGRGLLVLAAALLAAPTAAQTIVSRIELSAPFAAPPGWRFLAFQGPGSADDFEPEGRAPGAIRLCISRDGGRSCRPDLSRLLSADFGGASDAVPHFLNQVRIVQGRAGQALLLIQVASLQSGDGDQRV